MTDLVSLIKEAIMNAPTRSFDGKMNYQGMAEAAARVAVEEAEKQCNELKRKHQNCYDIIENSRELAKFGMVVCDDIARRMRKLIPKPSE